MFNQVKALDAVNSFKWLSGRMEVCAIILLKIKTMKKIINWFLNPPVTGQVNHSNHSPDGRNRIFLGRHFEICLCKSGCWTVYETGFSLSRNHCTYIATGEIIGGLLLIFWFFTRIIAFYFIIQMIVAVLSTKIDLYFGRSPLPMPPAPPKMGIWAVLHEIRSDYAQILTCLFLLIEGAGRRSLDFIISTTQSL